DELEAELPFPPGPRGIEIRLVPRGGSAERTLRLVSDVAASALCAVSRSMAQEAGGGGLPEKCRFGCTTVVCSCFQCQATQCCGLGDNICSCRRTSCSVTCASICTVNN